MPPVGYNPDPKVKVPDPSRMMNEMMDQAMKNASAGIHTAANSMQNAVDVPEKPEWADKAKPFN